MAVCRCLIEHDVRAFVDQMRKRLIECFKELLVTAVRKSWHFQRPAAGAATHAKAAAKDGDRREIGQLCAKRFRAVTAMFVAIQHGNAPVWIQLGNQRQTVEHAKATPPIWQRMVKTTGEINRYPVCEGKLRRPLLPAQHE